MKISGNAIKLIECIYCGLKKPPQEFSKEHILPQALGGNISDATANNQICRRCNNNCGLFIDAPFLKSWFIKNTEASEAFCYVDPPKAIALPLTYLGQLNNLESIGRNDVCELWLSPCGSRILHIHNNYDERYYGYAGGFPIARRKNPGRAIFLNVSTDEWWVRTGLESFKTYFEAETRFVSHIKFDDQNYFATIGSMPSPNEEKIIEEYSFNSNQSNGYISLSFSVSVDFEQRFLAKLALGLGHKCFGGRFLKTKHISILRSWLKEKDPEKRKNLPGISNSYFDSDPEIYRHLAWKGGIFLALQPIDSRLILNFFAFGKVMHTVVSDAPDLWESDEQFLYGGGICYLIIPQRNFFWGPQYFKTYINHRFGIASNPSLKQAESWRIDPAALPPRISNTQ
ncbi:MAG: HNH endonuclease [Nitrospirales bacterium]|nr:HNH endonuclease [Nitrospirales bacterium]